MSRNELISPLKDTIKFNEQFLLSSAKQSFIENKFLEAGEYLQKLIKDYPPKSEYFSAMAIIWKKIGNFEEAEKNYLKAIELNPELWEAYYNLGILYHENNNINSAIEFYKRSIDLNHGFYLSYYNLGNAYREIIRLDEALSCYEKSIELKHDYSEAYYNIGVIKELINNYDDALKYYNRAIYYNSAHVNAHWNKSLLLLSKGELADGFKEYEWRTKRKEFIKRNYLCPELTNQNITGKNVIVYCEQGLGDSLQFIRYIELLKNKGCNITLECNELLFELFKSVRGIDKLLSSDNANENKSNFDFNISLLSLPAYFNTTLEDIPVHIPYIFPPIEVINEWRRKLGNENKYKIGLIWGGNPNHGKDNKRSILLSNFIPLSTVEGIKLYSLQKGDPLLQIPDSNIQIENLSEKGQNTFIDTAAIIVNLDLIISVDTSVAHLAGAMGRPIWTLLPYNSDWRWLKERDDCPWYPTMKLFRQPQPDRWDSVIDHVKNELLSRAKQDNFNNLHDKDIKKNIEYNIQITQINN